MMGNFASVPTAVSANVGGHGLTLSSAVQLSNGVSMPRLGFGVWQVDPAICTSVVNDALAAGYRHIDSAQVYRNEAEAGLAVRQSNVNRSEIFVTTKIYRDNGGVEANYQSVLDSVHKINGDDADDAYVDLFLVHTPRMGAEGIKNVWQALERLYSEGKTRSIGVSNFLPEHIEGMKQYAKVWPPHVNQIQLNPWVQERDVVDYCEDKDIVIQAYSPLATGRRLDDPVVGEIAKHYKKSPAQVLIRYALQKGWVPLPKSIHKDRIVENTKIYDFHISKEDMSTLDGLNGKSVVTDEL